MSVAPRQRPSAAVRCDQSSTNPVRACARIVRAGTGLGVKLHGADGQRRVSCEPLHGAVVERAWVIRPGPKSRVESRSDLGRANGEAVVLGGHQHPAGVQLEHGWLAPRWPNRSLNVSRPSACPSSWWPRQIPNSGTAPTDRAHLDTQPGVPPGRPGRSRARSRRAAVASTWVAGVSHGNTVTRAPASRSMPHDRALDAVVEHRDVRRARAPRPGARSTCGRDTWPRQRLARHRRRRADQLEHLGIAAVPVDTAARTEPPSRSRRVMARVSTPCRPTTPQRRQPVGEALAPVRRGVSALADDHRPRAGRRDSEASGLHPVVADHRLREGDELARERRIGDHLLIAGHRGREHHLADARCRARRTAGRGERCRPRAPGTRTSAVPPGHATASISR